MTWEGWFTLGVIIVLAAVFVTDRVAPAVSIGSAVIVCYLAGVVDLGEAFSGFSNSAPITVAALYVLAGAAERTGALATLTDRALGSAPPATERRALARIAFPTTAVSGFIANTPLVALLTPRVIAWARRHDISPSRFLMPLSFATILGGVITVLGTSTNLVVNGALEEFGGETLGIFEITPVGVTVAVLGVLLLVALSPRLLPDRRAPGDDVGGEREFTIEMLVAPRSPLIGRTVATAHLRNLQGVFLVEIEREGRIIAPVGPDQVLAERDRLVFAGNVERVVDLERINGLVIAEEHHFDPSNGQRYFEAVVAPTGPLAGTTLKDIGFRNRYGGAVVAIHRAGTRLSGKLGAVTLRGGDVLLVVAGPGFRERMRDRPDFSVVAALGDAAPIRRGRARIVEITTVAMLVLAGTGLVDLPKAALGAALALIVLRVLTPSEARESISLDIILMIAFSIGLGTAVSVSGLAAEVGELLIDISEPFGDHALLAAVMLVTLVMTELLSNNAAAALMLPIAFSAAAQSGVEVRSLAVAILVTASCSFLTPIGYQTNTMVFSMGGYRFTDFARLGAPLTVMTFASTLVIVPLVYGL